MSFTYDLTTAVGQIRLEIGDTDNSTNGGVKPPALTNFTDEELTHFYTQESSSVLAAAARACEVLARMWAKSDQSVRIRDYQITARQQASNYRALAKDLRQRSGTLYAGGSAPTTRVDGYSSDIHSQDGGDPGEYLQERPTIRWP